MDISVIVPVYNVEKYIERCIYSILNQEFEGSFEVIAVDDCSEDSSLQLLESIADKDKRLKVVKHNVNKKLSIARATGVKNSTGKFILNVDSDDYLLPRALERLHEKIKASDADIIVFNLIRENSKGVRREENKCKKEFMTQDKLEVQHLFLGTCVNKLIKRKVLNELVVWEISINSAEDLLFSTELLLKATKFHILPEYYYVYAYNNNSLTNKTEINEIFTNLIIVLDVVYIISKKYSSSDIYIKNVLNYLEQSVIILNVQTKFIKSINMHLVSRLLSSFMQFNGLSESNVKNLTLSFKNNCIALRRILMTKGLRVAAYSLFKRHTNKKDSN